MGRARRKPVNKKTLPFSPWILVGVAVIGVIILGAVLLIGKGNSSSSQISISQALDKYHAGAFILDVRTSEEWNQGHIPGSILIPLDQLPGRRYLCCRGSRSLARRYPGSLEAIRGCRSGPVHSRSRRAQSQRPGAPYSPRHSRIPLACREGRASGPHRL